MKVKLFQDFILVKVLDGEQVSAGGIVLVKPKDAKLKRCTILQLGPKVENEDLKVGQQALIYHQAGLPMLDETDISDEGHIIREENIYGILLPEEVE